ncbi:MAG: SusD/RagB family nutrient-binding outer membrane lipoprotein [Bacteroidota bacterium]
MKLIHKNINKLFLLLAVIALPLSSCDQGFAEMNTNPNAINEIDYNYLLSYAQLQTSGERYENWRAILIYSSTMVQHLAALPTYWSGDKYLFNQGYSASLWERGYRNYIKEIAELLDKTAGDPDYANLREVTRIWRVAAFHRMTDLYGDIPYSEAGNGFLTGNFSPAYDSQESIYRDMLKELDEAASAVGSGSDEVPGDLIYDGDFTLWKKYAYSLMLRLAMRCSEVDPALAQEYVGKATTGGVMTALSESALVPHEDGPGGINRNGVGEVFAADDNQRLSATFVDWMDGKGDPRLAVLGVVASGGDQKGLPNGFTTTSLANYPGGTDLETYSRVNSVIAQFNSPMMFQSYAEVELLLAEAAERGWHSGDAATHYENGVRAAMQQWGELYDASMAISETDIDDYIANNPYDAANAMEQIGEQYWAATFWNEYEAYANYRRTGYPDLVPVDFPGNEANSQVPRRLRYPSAEYGVNEANINAAIARQGADEFTTKMWWDAN